MSLSLSLYVDVDTGGEELHRVDLFWKNITHNVTPMWDKAGVYDALYMSNGEQAGDYLDVIRAGLDDMLLKPAEYSRLNPSNGWGNYQGAVTFLSEVLDAFSAHPKAIIYVSK